MARCADLLARWNKQGRIDGLNKGAARSRCGSYSLDAPLAKTKLGLGVFLSLYIYIFLFIYWWGSRIRRGKKPRCSISSQIHDFCHYLRPLSQAVYHQARPILRSLSLCVFWQVLTISSLILRTISSTPATHIHHLRRLGNSTPLSLTLTTPG